jgi:hypothetical protein
MPILQMTKLRLRKACDFLQSLYHLVSEGQSQGLSPGGPISLFLPNILHGTFAAFNVVLRLYYFL